MRLCFWGLALLLALALACRQAGEEALVATPTPVVRAGELYTCANGADGCRVTYVIGPVTRAGERLRIDFTVSLDGPAGGTTAWTNDAAMHRDIMERGGRGIVLVLATDESVAYELTGVGGYASIDDTLVAPVTHRGYWEFDVPDLPGLELLLSYPDFSDRPVPIVVPEP